MTESHMRQPHMSECKSEHNKTRISWYITSTYVGKLPLPFDNALPKNSSKIEIELSFPAAPPVFGMRCFSMEYLSSVASASHCSVPFRILGTNSVEEETPPDGSVCFWCTPMLSEMPFLLLLEAISVADWFPSTWLLNCTIVGNLSSLAGMWA